MSLVILFCKDINFIIINGKWLAFLNKIKKKEGMKVGYGHEKRHP